MAFDETGMDPIGTFSVVTDGRLISCFNKTNVTRVLKTNDC